MLFIPQQIATPTLTVDLGKPGVAVSSNLYGLMTEEINHANDGGLYAELVRNRAFLDDRQKPVHWSPIDDRSTAELAHGGGVNASLPATLRFSGGVANEGYWGIPVRPSTEYTLTLWAKTTAPGQLDASIESSDGSTVYAKAKVDGLDASWRKFTAKLVTSSGYEPTTHAKLVLRSGYDRTTSLGFVSLFPPTYNDRPNGLRPDLMRMLVDMKPSFLRFPGGNYLEGGNFADRFDWKKTLGPVDERPGHMAPWGYRSTDGLGLMEYLRWTEDMGAKPVLAVFAGYVLRGDHIGEGTELSGFVQDALDEIEYIVGGPNTKWGAQRVRDGHRKPFPLEYVEVGNEDGFDMSGSYEGRFVQFYDAIKKKYPKLKVISTTGGKDYLGARFPIKRRRPDLVDEHYYASDWDMMSMAAKYDDYDRNGPKIFVGEWATQGVSEPWNNAGQKGPTPNMGCAIADAAFMTGLERNSDIVQMACYAPLLVNVNPGGRQWAVNLVGYDALTSFGSPSYYVQKLFKETLGDRTVPFSLKDVPTQTRADRSLPGLFVSVTRDTKHGLVYTKLVNPLATPLEVTFDFVGGKLGEDGTMTVLAGDPAVMNTVAEPTLIAPTTTKVGGIGATFRQTLPPHSVSVLAARTVK